MDAKSQHLKQAPTCRQVAQKHRPTPNMENIQKSRPRFATVKKMKRIATPEAILKRRIAPPQVNFDKLNPNISMEASCLHQKHVFIMARVLQAQMPLFHHLHLHQFAEFQSNHV